MGNRDFLRAFLGQIGQKIVAPDERTKQKFREEKVTPQTTPSGEVIDTTAEVIDDVPTRPERPPV